MCRKGRFAAGLSHLHALSQLPSLQASIRTASVLIQHTKNTAASRARHTVDSLSRRGRCVSRSDTYDRLLGCCVSGTAYAIFSWRRYGGINIHIICTSCFFSTNTQKEILAAIFAQVCLCACVCACVRVHMCFAIAECMRACICGKETSAILYKCT